MASKYHNLSNEALADEIGRADAIAKAAEAELKALKDEFKARGLDCAEGLVSTVTAAEVFKNTLDTARVREGLGDHVKQFEWHEHFKSSSSASRRNPLRIGARKSGTWRASAGRKSLTRRQRSMPYGAAARRHNRPCTWWG
jgi:hypothetical protein